MSIKLGFAVFVLASSLASATYAADSKGGGGSKGGGSHGGSSHGGSAHASHGGEHGGHGGGHGGHEAKGGHGGHGGKIHPGFAGAFRNPLFWLYWPFAYYAGPDQLALTCGEDVTDVVGLPLDQFREALHPTDELAAALDDLGTAVVKATQDMKIACPSEPPLTAPGRLAAMQRRFEAMSAAVDIVQPPMEKFYGLLNDEQKAKLNVISVPVQPPGEKGQGPAGDCGPSQLSGMELPAPEIDKAIHMTDPQRTSLVALQNADTQAAADLLKATCGVETPITPLARLAAVRKRIDAMLAADKTLSVAMNDFYGTLSDEQKAKFEAIGPIADTEEAEPEPARAPARRVIVGPPPVGAAIRRLLPF